MKKKLVFVLIIVYTHFFNVQSAAVVTKGLGRLGQASNNSGSNLRRLSTTVGQNTSIIGAESKILVPYKFAPENLPKDAEWYQVLGVSENAAQAEISAAYKNLMKIYHPDRNKTAGTSQIAQRLGQAYSKANELVDFDKKMVEIISKMNPQYGPSNRFDNILYAPIEIGSYLKHSQAFGGLKKTYQASKERFQDARKNFKEIRENPAQNAENVFWSEVEKRNVIQELKNKGCSPTKIGEILETTRTAAIKYGVNLNNKFDQAKSLGHAAYTVPVLVYGGSKDKTTLNPDYAYPDEDYFGGMEAIESKNELTPEYNKILDEIIDEVISKELTEESNLGIQDNFSSDFQLKASPNEPVTWWDSMRSQTYYAINSASNIAQSSMELASENPIATGVVVAGISAGLGKLAYDYYIKHYGVKPAEEQIAENKEIKE